ncbi:hypothetical protein ACFLSZ_06790 [Candidatus Bipolaricaulota bacterium]
MIVEFAGMPNTGKTSCIDLVADYFRRQGHGVRVEGERAQVCPFFRSYRRRFATWMAEQAVATIHEAVRNGDGETLVLVDRGIFDSIAFLKLLCIENLMEKREFDSLVEDLGLLRAAQQTEMVLLYTAKPETSQSRDVITRMFGFHGAITNPSTLKALLSAYAETLVAFGDRFPDVRLVDTDLKSPADVLSETLSYIEGQQGISSDTNATGVETLPSTP